MDTPRWLTRKIVDTIHEKQLQQHGGLPGVRDDGAVESALARPKHLWTYAGDEEAGNEDLDLIRLAASYGYGIARNHGYRDGNKRTAFMATYVFLRLNGHKIEAQEPEVVDLMRAVAEGACDEIELAEWLRAHTVPVDPPS
jgi:death-on-curing protein